MDANEAIPRRHHPDRYGNGIHEPYGADSVEEG